MSEYDALADLFLSDGGPALKGRPRSVTEHAPVRPHEIELPITLPEVPATSGHAWTDPEALPAITHIEGLILGHLPVLATAWVVQYASHVAHELRQPVGVMRVQPRGEALSVAMDIVLPSGVRRASAPPCAQVDDAIVYARARAARWLIRVEGEPEPAMHMMGVDSVTLLTGADDAAVVSSYRTLKVLSESSRQELPHLRIAIMGSADAKASAAEDRLLRAATAFLQRNIEPAARVQRIATCVSETIFRGETLLSCETLIAKLGGAHAEAVTPEEDLGPHEDLVASMFAPTRDEATRDALIDVMFADRPQGPTPAFVPTPTRAERPPAPGVTGTSRERRRGSGVALTDLLHDIRSHSCTAVHAPKPVRPRATPMQTSHAFARELSPHHAEVEESGPDLSAHAAPVAASIAPASTGLAAHIAGLMTIDVRCPYAPGVEFAMDGGGGLHLLTRGSGGGEPVSDLMVASAWAADHASLLTRVAPQLVVDAVGAGQGATLHILTDNVTQLRSLMTTSVRVHLWMEVPSDCSVVCKQLN
jgi:hypothetical protein